MTIIPLILLTCLVATSSSSSTLASPAHGALASSTLHPPSPLHSSSAPHHPLALEHPHQKLVTRRSPLPKITKPTDHVRLDPANIVVVLLAAILLVYSSRRSLKPPSWDIEGSASGSGEVQEQGEVGLSSAGMFLVVSSASLLLIFYFISAMTVLITIIFCLITTLSLATLVYPYFDYWTGFKYNRDVEIPLLGPIPVLGCALGPLSLAVVILWVVTKSWILNDILAISLVVFFLTSVRVSSLKVGTALMTVAFFYDIFWVFCSSSVFGANVMVTVATQLNVPIKILVPLWFPQGSSDFTLIGLGDIVLPGLLVAFALRVDHITLNTPSLFGGYFFYSMCGYCVGLLVCEVIVASLHVAQPAMIYLVPGDRKSVV